MAEAAGKMAKAAAMAALMASQQMANRAQRALTRSLQQTNTGVPLAAPRITGSTGQAATPSPTRPFTTFVYETEGGESATREVCALRRRGCPRTWVNPSYSAI